MSFELVCLVINIMFTFALLWSMINHRKNIKKAERLIEQIKKDTSEFWENVDIDS